MIKDLIYIIGLGVEYVGVFVVMASAVVAVIHLISAKHKLIEVRSEFAQNVMFGLEFIIAADILLVTVATDLNEVMQLGGIVLIRILLGCTLRKEMLGDKRIKLFKKK